MCVVRLPLAPRAHASSGAAVVCAKRLKVLRHEKQPTGSTFCLLLGFDERLCNSMMLVEVFGGKAILMGCSFLNF